MKRLIDMIIWVRINADAIRIFLLTIILGMVFFLIISQQASNSRQLKAQTALLQEVKRQGQLNQKYIRCVVLIPPEVYNNRQTLPLALDQCALD